MKQDVTNLFLMSCQEFLEYIRQFAVSSTKYKIPLSIFFSSTDEVTSFRAGLISWAMNEKIEHDNIPLYCDLMYNEKYIYVRWRMKKKLYLEFPYLLREEYQEGCYLINNVVGRDGTVMLSVNNIPSYAIAVLNIECTEAEFDKIIPIVEKYNFNRRGDKGLDEVLKEHASKTWNTTGFIPGMSVEMFDYVFNSMFLFPSKKELEKEGYAFDNEVTKKKVFISYSHEDKEVVRSLVTEFEDYGLDIFIDIKSIDYGENILNSYTQGIKESDLVVAFLSENYKKSLFAKHELVTAFSQVVQGRKKFFPIKLDGVNPNEIIYSLSDYKYYDFCDERNVIDLVKAIEGILNKEH